MIRIIVDEIDALISSDEIEDYVREEQEDMMTGVFTDLTSPSPIGVPVDTGVLRNSIQLDLQALEVYSTNPYAAKVNDGSSKKSPAGHWEAAADRNARK